MLIHDHSFEEKYHRQQELKIEKRENEMKYKKYCLTRHSFCSF